MIDIERAREKWEEYIDKGRYFTPRFTDEKMPSTQALLKAYGQIPIPGNYNSEMTYQEAFDRELDRYSVRTALMRLYERDVATIKEDRGS